MPSNFLQSYKNILRSWKKSIQLSGFRCRYLRKEKYECPICGYYGPFEDVLRSTGLKKHCRCPKCRSLERHRLQYLVTRSIFANLSTSQMAMLHVAPEACMKKVFAKQFGKYETADLYKQEVDHNVDLQNLPFADSSYDVVFASHVLEHIPDDQKAIQEIRRVLKPEGIAILPVPLVSESTIEYPEPNPHEFHHIRAPGFDYFERYLPYFSKVEKYSSEAFPERYQLFLYEDRSIWPTANCPLRRPMSGTKHLDVVPVCYV